MLGSGPGISTNAIATLTNIILYFIYLISFYGISPGKASKAVTKLEKHLGYGVERPDRVYWSLIRGLSQAEYVG